MAAEGYQSGFGNHFATEAVAGALPVGRNSPQKPAFGLYAEQLSGTAFTAPRHDNRRTWMYRLRPSAAHPAFEICLSYAAISGSPLSFSRQYQAKAASFCTTVAVPSPRSTAARLPGSRMLNTTIGILLSRHNATALASITFRLSASTRSKLSVS